MLINRNIVALFALPFMASATASELSIGAGAAYNESPYRGYNENTKAIPLISYEGDTFYVRQTTLGFILSQSEKNELREGANKRGNSSRLTQSFHFFMFEPIFSPVNALNQPI